jgi:hypothetical protein
MVTGWMVDFWALIYLDGGWVFLQGVLREIVFSRMVFCGEFVVFWVVKRGELTDCFHGVGM